MRTKTLEEPAERCAVFGDYRIAQDSRHCFIA